MYDKPQNPVRKKKRDFDSFFVIPCTYLDHHPIHGQARAWDLVVDSRGAETEATLIAR